MSTIKSQTAQLLFGLPFTFPKGIHRIVRHDSETQRDAKPPRSQSEGYTERQKRIIALVEDCYEVTAGMVAADEQIALSSAKRHLAKLVDDGILCPANLARAGMAPCIIWRMAEAAKTEEASKEAA